MTIINEDSDAQVIEMTDSHPFWVVTDEPDLSRTAGEYVDENGAILYHENLESSLSGYWVEAKDLREGDVFLGTSGELSTLVTSERIVFPDGVKVYNFTVDGNHDYFVLAETGDYGQTSILVHNAEWYIQEGVRRSVAARENGLTHILADVTENGVTEQRLVPITELQSPKVSIVNDDRYKKAEVGMSTPDGRVKMPNINIEPLGSPGQTGSTPLSEVKIIPLPD